MDMNDYKAATEAVIMAEQSGLTKAIAGSYWHFYNHLIDAGFTSDDALKIILAQGTAVKIN